MNMLARKTASRDIYRNRESIREATVHISPCHSILGEVGGTPKKIKIISYHSRLALISNIMSVHTSIIF